MDVMKSGVPPANHTLENSRVEIMRQAIVETMTATEQILAGCRDVFRQLAEGQVVTGSQAARYAAQLETARQAVAEKLTTWETLKLDEMGALLNAPTPPRAM
jgi:predicted transcriptional regulator